MKRKDMIRYINEEISDFDFLNNDQYQKEKENLDLIQNEDFQKQFLIDSILKKDRVKLNTSDARVTGDYETPNESGSLGIEYYSKVDYKYDSAKKPISFFLNFDGDMSFVTKGFDDDNAGSNITQPLSQTWFDDIQWNEINVGLSSLDGDDIKFIAYEKAPDKIKNIFVRTYLESLIRNETSQGIDMKPETFGGSY